MNPWDLQMVAKRVVWFKKPEDALQDTKLFLAHVMTYGTLSDITTTLHYFSESDFESVLDDPPPGSLTVVHGHTGTCVIVASPCPPYPGAGLLCSNLASAPTTVRCG
jgi:hypothetical protein